MPTLETLLAAGRADLIDGFPMRAVLAAAKTANPFERLNELLSAERIVVKHVDAPPADIIVINPYMLKHGIVAAFYDATDDFINVIVDNSFFETTNCTAIIKALTFQSVCVHQLLHRERGHQTCRVFYQPLAESMNNEQELEAMAAGLAHDIRCKGIVSVTGEEQLQELSPRLANIMANSSAFEPGSIPKLNEYVKKFI